MSCTELEFIRRILHLKWIAPFIQRSQSALWRWEVSGEKHNDFKSSLQLGKEAGMKQKARLEGKNISKSNKMFFVCNQSQGCYGRLFACQCCTL